MDSKVFRWFRNDIKVLPNTSSCPASPSELDKSTPEDDKTNISFRVAEDRSEFIGSSPSLDSNSVSELWEEAQDEETKFSKIPNSASEPIHALTEKSIVNPSFTNVICSNPRFNDGDILNGKQCDLSKSLIEKSSSFSGNVFESESMNDKTLDKLNPHVIQQNDLFQHLKCDSLSTLGMDGDDNFSNTIIGTALPNTDVEIANGSDSGVETNGKCFKETEIEASCDSSQISRSSSPFCAQFDSEELLSSCSAANSQTLHFSDTQTSLDYIYAEGTSEGGSESSSVTGSSHKDVKSNLRRRSTNDKHEPSSRLSPFSNSMSKEGVSRKSNVLFATPSSKSVSTRPRDTSESRTSKSGRSLSSSRSKPVPLIDDGRWPYSSSKSHAPVVSKPKSLTIHSSDKKFLPSPSSSPSENKLNPKIIEKYATLPRRRKQKSNENLATSLYNSQSKHRDPSLNRAETLRRKHRESNLMTSSLTSNCKSLPPYPVARVKSKTKIYHETCTQTSFTSKDIDLLIAGNPVAVNIHKVETADTSIQVDLRNDQIEALESLVKQLKEDLAKSEAENTVNKREFSRVARELDSVKLTGSMIEQQFKVYEERICKLLLKKVSDVSGDYLTELERQTIRTNELVRKQQAELKQFYTLYSKLQKELETSKAAQKSMLQTQQELECESLEMQEFLQAEKLSLIESIKELENEVKEQKALVKKKEEELAKQKEECSHLVRIAEQRRQENLTLETKANVTEQRSKAFLLQQGASVSGASVALSGLGDRLENLIDQLVAAYNISEADLEEVIYHNEAFSRSCSTSDGSSKISSPLDGKMDISDSFKNALIAAIKNSPTPHSSSQISSSDSTNQLSSNENAPVSRFENSVSKNSLKQTVDKIYENGDENSFETENLVPNEYSAFDGQILNGEDNYSSNLQLTNSESLQNLSDAILSRQQLEKIGFEEEEEDEDSFFKDFNPNHTLVDQVIEIDNLVVKLLKLLRIFQLEKESSLSQLLMEKNSLVAQIQQLTESKMSINNTSAKLEKMELSKMETLNKVETNGTNISVEASHPSFSSIDQPVILKKLQNSYKDVTHQDNCLINPQDMNANADSSSLISKINSSALSGL